MYCLRDGREADVLLFSKLAREIIRVLQQYGFRLYVCSRWTFWRNWTRIPGFTMLNEIISRTEMCFSLVSKTDTWNSRYWDLYDPDFFVEVLLQFLWLVLSWNVVAQYWWLPGKKLTLHLWPVVDIHFDHHFWFQVIASRSKFRELLNGTQHVAIGPLIYEICSGQNCPPSLQQVICDRRLQQGRRTLMHETQLNSAGHSFFNFKGRLKSHIDKKNEYN